MVGLTLITHCDLEHKSKEEEEEEATTLRVCNGTVSLSNRERSALECTGPHNMHIAFAACLPIHELYVHEFQGTELNEEEEEGWREEDA